MSSSHEADAEVHVGRTSVRTTIVGGQPPGNARPLGEVPIGMERLLGLAAVDDRLAAELERDPRSLAEECGITLEPTELSVLAATPPGALRGMLDGIRTGLAEPARREFMKRASVLAVALFATGGAAAGGCKKTTPDPSPAPGSGPGPGATDMGSPSAGMDTPPEDMAPPPRAMTAEPDAGPPPRTPPPYVDQVKRGVSPRRPRPPKPPPTTTGVRPK